MIIHAPKRNQNRNRTYSKEIACILTGAYLFIRSRELESKKLSSRIGDHTQNILLLDVTSLSLGIEDVNGEMCTIICRNRTLPTKSAVYSIFTNAYAYQTNVVIRVFCGEHRLTKYNVRNSFR